MIHTTNNYITPTHACLAAVICAFTTLQGCQSIKQPTINNPQQILTNDALVFDINGKIAARMPTSSANTMQSTTLSYAWTQRGDDYVIDLSSAFGLANARLTGSKDSATFSSGLLGKYSAETPEQLLKQTSGLEIPISQLPKWVMGRQSENAVNNIYDSQGRLSSTTEAANPSRYAWNAVLSYKDMTKLPSKLVMHQQIFEDNSQNPRVILLINR